MFDRVPRQARILALLAVFALGLALATNALVARLLTVDANKLAEVSRRGTAVASGSPEEGGSEATGGETGDAEPAESSRSGSQRPRRLAWYQDPIIRRNLFDSANALSGMKPDGPKEGDGDDDGAKSELDAVLITTSVASDPIWSTALLSVSSAAPEVFRNGEALLDATIVDIRSPWLDEDREHHAARVVILRDGRREFIDAGGAPKPGARPKGKATKKDAKKPKKKSGRHTWDGIKDLGGGKYSVEQAEIDYALSNLDKLSREARIVPNFADGSTNGFKVFSIRRNSALRKMGLKNNDVLTSVNGFDLSDTEKALEIYSKLQSDKSFSLEVLRNGEPMTLEYSVQ
jgi:general secretion pathway protein C